MGHHDGHNHHDLTVDSTEAVGNIRTAFFLNVCFTIIEIAGGIWTNSMAIIADAVHDLGDSISLGFSLVMQRISGKKRDQKFSYGYRRFSLLAALINSLVLILGSIFILLETIPRLFHPASVYAPGMLILAVLGILFNGAAVLRLKKAKTMNERVVSWHLLEDVLGWVAIFIVALILIFYNIPILDPILSIGFTLFILFNVIRTLIKSIKLFLQGIPDSIQLEKIEGELRSIPGIISLHDTHIWSLDGHYHVLSTHLVVPGNATMDLAVRIKNQARHVIHNHMIPHATVEVECEGEDCQLKDC